MPRPGPRHALALPLPLLPILLVAGTLAAPVLALEPGRLLRQPDVSADRLVFVYGDDLWTVARQGGVATRLTSHEGLERFPKFSPDGTRIAFTAEYDGNLDAYVVPAEGGEPTRLTWHPAVDSVAEWYPDGESLLLRSARASSIQRYDRFFKAPARPGFEEMLPLPTGGFASFSPDGQALAFVSPSYDNRTWKRYRGGMAPDIWIYDFAANRSEKISDWEGPDEWPAWQGRTVYYVSDRGGRTANLWAYDVDARSNRQVTHFDDFDCKWASGGPGAVAFEKGGWLWLLELPEERAHPVEVRVPDDKPDSRAEYREVAKWTGRYDLSPSAKRAVIEARGDLFTVPAEKGDVRNLTRSPAWRERDPAWSADGKWIAYLSDQSGEYELWVVASDGSAAPRQVTRGGSTFRFPPRWSPDGKKLAFADKTLTLWWCEVASGALHKVDQAAQGEIQEFDWSPDSRWLAYVRPEANYFGTILLHSLESGRNVPVSSGMHDDFSPAFDPQGRYLYFVSRRTLEPVFGTFEGDFRFAATDKLYAVTLRADLPSPVAPESDEETGAAKAAEGEKKDGKKDEKKTEDGASKAGGRAGPDAYGAAAAPDGDKSDKGDKGDKAKAGEALRIDLDGIASRAAVLPVPAGRYTGLKAFDKQLLYVDLEEPELSAEGNPAERVGAIRLFDLEKRERKTVIEHVAAAYAASRSGDKLLYHDGDTFGIVEAKEGKKSGDGKVETAKMMALVDPRAERQQMFDEAWRLERDFYYDPAMGGLDWKAVGDRYRELVPYVAQRSDFNYILGELIGELATSHTYVGGGDARQARKVEVGLLGADYEVDARSGLYRFRRIYRQRDWNSKVAAPLGEPGIDVREGDYLLEVNGHRLALPENLFAAFVGTTDRLTTLRVASSPDDPKPRTVAVKPVGSESSLRYAAWVQENRDRVARATGGRVAYVHIPDTSTHGIQEFAKQFYPQVDRAALIVDDRFNSGGQIPDFFVERLGRRPWAYWSSRDGIDFRTPLLSLAGPRCMLINQYAGSGGDALPFFFRKQGLGPLIGKRTWGGLVGYDHELPLVDGGLVTMPDFGMWTSEDGWVVENHGVDPDLEVENAPHDLVAGRDPQLERAIAWCLEELDKHPLPPRPPRPRYKVQAP